MALLSKEDAKRIGRAAYSAIVRSGIVNGDVLALTTTAGLKAVVIAAPATKEYYLERTRKYLASAMDVAISAGLFTNTNVAAADTTAGLLALCTAAAWDADAAKHVNALDNWWN